MAEGVYDLENFSIVGKSVPRVDVEDKAAGRVKYINDTIIAGVLHAKLHTSLYAHAKIISIATPQYQLNTIPNNCVPRKP
ncbi:hypothetical protein [Paenibacillus periandrae]|uniref:hypothetical protein n=1 Tax=Paenibacillus periandrae TaxID=1761741 RepID=UPI001F093597|nr:hypothetical protein [Paenibacillus periandrae]